MEIINETPFEAGALMWEDLEGKPRVTVVVKATFTMKNGTKPVVAKQQLPLFRGDVMTGEGEKAMVRFESDMVPVKPRADVVVVGRAHAPGGRPVRMLDSTLRVGGRRWRIRVFGDRRWSFASSFLFFPQLSRPEPFVSMELGYDRAFGGIDSAAARYCPENLAGRGFIGKKSPKCIHGKSAPNLENPGALVHSWSTKPKPVGFGFYGRGWMPRLKYAGTYDEKYRKERAPKTPMDFSYAFYNGAHPELQVEGHLRGDEPVELSNLSPAGELHFSLPAARPTANLLRWKVTPEEWLRANPGAGKLPALEELTRPGEAMTMVLDTLVFVPEENIFYEVFRGNCAIPSLENPGMARCVVKV